MIALEQILAEVEPVAWIIPGDDNADSNGFLDCMICKEGEFTSPLYSRDQVLALLTALQAAFALAAREAEAGAVPKMRRSAMPDIEELKRMAASIGMTFAPDPSLSPFAAEACASPHAPDDDIPEFKPCIVVYQDSGISEMLLEDCPTITGEEMTVRSLRRMAEDKAARDIVGFQWWTVNTPGKQEGGDK